MAIYLAEKLKLDRHSKKLFINLVRLEHLTNSEVKKVLQLEINQQLKNPVRFKLLSEDIFNLVADWPCFAIMELTCVENFKSDPIWISRKLKISLPQVKLSIERLMRAGLLQEADGVFKKTQKDYLFENIPSAAIRKHHHDTLDLAKKALEEQDMSQREFFTICFPMDPAMISKAKKRIKEFSEALMEEMQESKPKSVYKVAIQLFRLDKEIQ